LILAIDVGKGTEDVLLFEESEPIENSLQLVLPSTAQIFKKQLEKDVSERIVISGEIMAGEPWHKVVYAKTSKNPESVIMSSTAAKSLRYNLDQVRIKGVKIVRDDQISEFTGSQYYLSDINWQRIDDIISSSGYNLTDIDTVLLCCQDHGEPTDPNQGVRDFRMKSVYQPLQKNGRLEDLLIRSNDIPKTLPRHQSISKSAINHFDYLDADNVFVMDSSPAVVLGGLLGKKKELAINVGNGHTLAVFLRNQVVQAIYELHTGGVVPDTLMRDLQLLSQNKLHHEEILARGGHGIFKKEKMDLSVPEFEDYLPITLIGPNRSKLMDLEVNLVHPGGNMMMAGPIGLIQAYHYLMKRS
jgi:uncharacterized protein (DUF1786 family)